MVGLSIICTYIAAYTAFCDTVSAGIMHYLVTPSNAAYIIETVCL